VSFPDFYNSEAVGTLYPTDTNAAVNAGHAAGLSAAADDSERIALLLIDMQVDFIHEDGALYVPGAIEDTRRLIEWLYHNTGRITQLVASLDSHLPIQIFSPAWWVNADGDHPDPMTLIQADDVQNGTWQPLYDKAWSKEYVERLEENAKKQLMIWPYHTLIGTPGHNLTPALYEAIAYHSSARQTQPRFEMKGTVPRTEHYSLFEPEVKGDAGQELVNTELLDDLADYDVIYVAGQAKSHCVLESVSTMMRYFEKQPDVIEKIHLLMDTTSSVQSPDVDFEAIAQEQYEQFAKHGLNLTSTDEVSL
jgi:nicotinamidase-related amidase